MTRPLLRRKLAGPPPWADAIARPRLLAELDQAVAEGRHVLLCAGTGYGKTALLAEWTRGRHAAWLTLDAEDADLDAFLTYLVATCEKALPDFTTEARAMLGRAREREGATAALSSLIADLDEQVDEPLVLVLDDYHLAASPSLDALVARLVKYLPPSVRLALATRQAPEIGLATFQARRELLVLDEPTLAFDLAELAALRPGIGEREIADLLASTGGWPAAMGLTTELLEAYLEEQMLAGRAPEQRALLQRLALLDTLEPRTCEEALGLRVTPALLDELRRDRVLFSHAGERPVMHPALRTMLRRRLMSELPREERRALLRRVGDYYWQAGQGLTALRFWIDAGKAAWAAEKLIGEAEGWLAQGRLEALAAAVAALGAEAERPELLMLRGELHRRWGEFARAEALLEQAVEAFGPGPGPKGRALAQLRQAQVAASCGNVATARERLAEAGPLLADDERVMIDVRIVEGGLALLTGDAPLAIARFEAALAAGQRLDDPYAQARAIHNLGVCYTRLGEFARALECYDAAMRLPREDGTPTVWMTPVNRALVLVQLDRPAEAIPAAEAALALVRRYRLNREEGYALRILGYARMKRGDRAQAAACFEAAELQARRTDDALALAYSINFRADLALLEGDVEAAKRLSEEVERLAGGEQSFRNVPDFVQVREKLLAATGAHDEPALRIRCFGGLRVQRKDGEIADREWQTLRAKLLFAFFLYAPEGATKAHLLEAAFPRESISNDLMNMTLMRLRKALEPDLEKGQPSRFLLRQDGRYLFDRQVPIQLDTRDFEQALKAARMAASPADERAALQRALELYTGHFLAEWDDDWIVALRLGFQEQALAACRRLAGLLDEAGFASAALELVDRALAIDPFSAEFNRALITRYLQAGERQRAVAHFQLLVQRYKESFDAPPPAELAALLAED